MLVGIIGPKSSIDILTATKTSLPIEFLPLVYHSFTEATALVKDNEDRCDALLFTGQTPYTYVSAFLQPHKPWEYLPRNVLSTMCALVEAGLIYGTIRSISMDGFNPEVMRTLQEEIHGTTHGLNFHNATFDILAPDYLAQVIAHHAENYQQGRADLCLTGNQIIFEELKKKRIPTIKANPNYALAQQKLELLLLKHKVICSEKSLPAVIVIKPTFQLDYNPYGQSELPLLRLKAKISEAIYYYAQKLNAAVYTLGEETYYLTCNGDSLDAETRHFTSIDDLLRSNREHPLLERFSLGIGLGITCQAAKYAAGQALKRAAENKGTCCYLLDEKQHFFGPLSLNDGPGEKIPSGSHLEAISRQTNIGLPTLLKIEQTLRQYQVQRFTSTELAFYCGMPLRSMNRLLQRLEEHGYVSQVGKDPQPATGRPRRLLKIDLCAPED